MQVSRRAALVACAAMATKPSFAAISATDAEKLKTSLTPMGAERAGNADGSIPAWNGGYTTVAPGWTNGLPRPDPFATEKPLFSIDAKNLDRYAGRLSAGTVALMKKYPTYRVDVYRTHRTAAAPQAVYDNSIANATRASIESGSMKVRNAYGGIPFPIPVNGVEAMWNRALRWQGEAVNISLEGWIVSSGSPVLTSRSDYNVNQFPYYFAGGSPDRWEGIVRQYLSVTQDPPQKSGEAFLGIDRATAEGVSGETWQYFPGQRRTRKTPAVKYDYPSPITNGITNYDDLQGFLGEFDRYEWKLVGKREMYVPYNTNGFALRKVEEVLGAQHLNPDHVRWELHRTWVVDGTLVAGKRNVSARRTLYLDEDSWNPVLADFYDAQGALWKSSILLPYLMPDVPAVVIYVSGAYNLLSGQYAIDSLPNGMASHMRVLKPQPTGAFTPDRLASLGQR